MILRNWLMGAGAVPKISVLNDAFKANRLRLATLHYEREVKCYHPILGHPTVYKKFSFDKFQELIQLNRLDFSINRLSLLKKAYEQLEYLVPFREEQFKASIFLDIKEKLPNCKSEFLGALSIIQKNCPWMYEIFESVNEEICPIYLEKKPRHNQSFTDYHVIGVIFCGLKPEPNAVFELAVCLSHELAHNVLHLYQAGQSPIAEESYHEEVYSGIRKTNRPVFGSLHAAVALGYMLSFCRGYMLNNRSGEFYNHACLRVKELEDALRLGLEALETIKFNELGVEIYKELKRLLI